MLLTTAKTAQLNGHWGMKHDSRRVLVDFITPSDQKGMETLTIDTNLHLLGVAGTHNCLNRCNSKKDHFSCL